MAGQIREYLHEGAVDRDMVAPALEIRMRVLPPMVDGVRDKHRS